MAKVSSICVFCGSSLGRDARYREAARHLGALLAKRGITLVYGGGGIGLMRALAEACLAAGGEVIGIIPSFLRRKEKGSLELSRLEVVASMHERKERMFALADAFIILPGGLGTLDETFEVLTWKQLELHDKPVVLVDIDGYWQPLLHAIARIVEAGFAAVHVRHHFSVVTSVEAALASILAAPRPATVPAGPERL
ncbi:MAG: TIGR00730 family Rossman fold protein [Alphaproteobacteria bacterium]